MQKTPNSFRTTIGIFGKTNSGKSSLINAITKQKVSIISDQPGTTTDPVNKTMELLPLGPVLFIDTAGINDKTKLEDERTKRSIEVINKIDIALYVIDNSVGIDKSDLDNLKLIENKTKNILVIFNKNDLSKDVPKIDYKSISISTNNIEDIEKIKQEIVKFNVSKDTLLIADKLKENDVVVLVTPIDLSAPKGRIILPQQLVLRELLDHNIISIVVQPEQLTSTLNSMKSKPQLVITDSQVFHKIKSMIEKNIPITSFSILLAKQKGHFETLCKGIETLKKIKPDANILIAESCTHHRTCDDIGTVKIPKWLKEHVSDKLNVEFNNGKVLTGKDIEKFDLIIMCGSCMINNNEVSSRIENAINHNVPITNYGMFIAYINNIFDESIKFIK